MRRAEELVATERQTRLERLSMDYRIVDGAALGDLTGEQAGAIAALVFSTYPRRFEREHGGRDRALQELAASLTRPGAEFWVGHGRIAVDPDRDVAGGYYALTGDRLRAVRLADRAAKLGSGDPRERRRTERRLARAAAAQDGIPDQADFLIALAVVPDHRGRGLGRALLEDWLRRSKEQGHTLRQLTVSRGNAVAKRLYASCGFVPVGAHRGTVTMRLEA